MLVFSKIKEEILEVSKMDICGLSGFNGHLILSFLYHGKMMGGFGMNVNNAF